MFLFYLLFDSYVVGGPEVARAMEGRTHYGRESVEDDPFIVAASMQSLNSVDGKKNKTDPIVNYGYMSEGTKCEMIAQPFPCFCRVIASPIFVSVTE